MWFLQPQVILVVGILIATGYGIDVDVHVTNLELDSMPTKDLKLTFTRDGLPVQHAVLNVGLGANIRKTRSVDAIELKGTNEALQFENFADTSAHRIIRINRRIPRGNAVSDCFYLGTNHWYGGPQQKYQYWPIEKLHLPNYSYLTKEADNCGIAERYWLSSSGVFIYIDDTIPLFVDQNHDMDGYVCFRGNLTAPYDVHANDFMFSYNIGFAENAKAAHMLAIKYFLNKPTGHPAEIMVRHPIWSTWAKYKRDINESTVLEFADQILANNFKNSQFEIDDDWEICYGASLFNESPSKFPNIRRLIQTLNTRGFRTTLWMHPFINKGCEPYYSEAKANKYLVEDYVGSTDTHWWNSRYHDAAYIDFMKPNASAWFTAKLTHILEISGIDSFKFDAGESSWSPPSPRLIGPTEGSPNSLTKAYIRTVAKFGSLVEVRSGQSTQDLPIFVRMIDKDSNWGWNNGLPTLITTLLQLNMNGYPLVLPDMIGGNGYQGAPDKELFIRWLAANVFMPSLQFSYVPWDYDAETIAISQKFALLHDQFTDRIMARFQLAVATGEPVNPPLWWIDPEDVIAQASFDQFLLGDDLIAAPCIIQGQRVRDVYLPKGTWQDGNSNTIHVGPKTITNYPAPLDVIPYFTRVVLN